MKDTLIIYQGGGYDGCIWEYNAFYFDSEGKPHNIYSSGYGGIWKRVLNRAHATDPVSEYEFRQSRFDEVMVEEPQEYPLPEGTIEFSKSKIATQFLYGVGKALQDAGYDVSMVCSACGGVCDLTELDYSIGGACGNGGIGIDYQDLICTECVSNNTCRHCNQYDPSAEDGVCSNCLREFEKEHEDLFDAMDAATRKIREQTDEMKVLRPKFADKFEKQGRAIEVHIAQVKVSIMECWLEQATFELEDEVEWAREEFLYGARAS